MKAEAKRRALNMKFHGAKDHLDQSMHEYKVRAARLGTVVWMAHGCKARRPWMLLLSVVMHLPVAADFCWSSGQLAPCGCGSFRPVLCSFSAQAILDDLATLN